VLRRDEVAAHVPGELDRGLEDALAGAREGHVRGQGVAARLARAVGA